MKKRIIPVCLVLVFMLCLLTFPASALLEESKYLSSYRVDAIARADGQIAIEASVRGTRMMDQIGIRRISIYAQSGNIWLPAGSFDSEDEGMSVSDNVHYGNTIYFTATSGTYYQIFVTIFAEDSSGSDSRTEICYVTAK